MLQTSFKNILFLKVICIYSIIILFIVWTKHDAESLENKVAKK